MEQLEREALRITPEAKVTAILVSLQMRGFKECKVTVDRHDEARLREVWKGFAREIGIARNATTERPVRGELMIWPIGDMTRDSGVGADAVDDIIF